MTDSCSSCAQPTTPVGAELDPIELVEARLSMLFDRTRVVWKESAAHIHPSLQPAGYKLLALVARRGPMHAGVLAELMASDKSVISRQLRVLHDLGLVEADEDPDDRRARVISVTPLGLERFDAVREINKAQLHGSLDGWTEHELALFAELLERLSAPRER